MLKVNVDVVKDSPHASPDTSRRVDLARLNHHVKILTTPISTTSCFQVQLQCHIREVLNPISNYLFQAMLIAMLIIHAGRLKKQRKYEKAERETQQQSGNRMKGCRSLRIDQILFGLTNRMHVWIKIATKRVGRY